MIIETERLYLIPLTADQLRLWIVDISALEKDLNCSYRAEPMNDVFLAIVKAQLGVTENDVENYLFHSFWFIMRKADRVIVGTADFKGIPNKDHDVEIGYGLGIDYEHNGYMTEAVQGMSDWAKAQDKIHHVIAETEINNPKSHNVLKRCGFVQYRQDTTLWWRN